MVVDYNSWVESEQGLKLAASLDKDVVLAEGKLNANNHLDIAFQWLTMHLKGYKEYKTGRTYMARMGDWRLDNSEEIELDGIGGVNIIVKADVHRAGKLSGPADPVSCIFISTSPSRLQQTTLTRDFLYRHQLPILRF